MDNDCVKLGDFGSSTIVRNEPAPVHTGFYSSPELMQSVIGDRGTVCDMSRCDVWSLGITLAVMLSGGFMWDRAVLADGYVCFI